MIVEGLSENATSIESIIRNISMHIEPVKILYLLVIIIGTWLIAGFFRKLLRRTLPRWMPMDIALAVTRTVYYTIWFLGIASILQYVFNIKLGSLLVAGGIAGIVLGFASQTVISNLLSGIFIYFDRPFKVGDAVDLPGQGISGVVTDIHIMSTRIRTWDGVYVRIPNQQLFNSVIKNLLVNAARRIEFKVGISYSSDIDKARRIMLEVADKHPFVLAEPEPEVFVEEYGSSSVNLSFRVWAPSSKWFDVRKALLEEIKKRFDEEGIEIPFTQVVNWFREPLTIRIEPSSGEAKTSS